MSITYETRKDLPCVALRDLFQSVGWSDGQETQFMLDHFNVSFINSTIVVSAWDEGKLIGCVRALSDKIFRSVIYDLAVMPEYQSKGIGKELVKRCTNYYPDTEWLVTTETATGFYKKIGFTVIDHNSETFLRIPSKWF